MKSGHEVQTADGLSLHYDEYGTGDRVILSGQVGFYPKGLHQSLAKQGYHVYCMTLRGFAPSSYVTENYGTGWYDRFADDVVCLADVLGLKTFVYMGASHGAGVGWHLVTRHPDTGTDSRRNGRSHQHTGTDDAHGAVPASLQAGDIFQLRPQHRYGPGGGTD